MSAPNHPASAGTPSPLTRGLHWRVFLRSLALQASWNHQRMQNLGLLVCLMPWLRARSRDPDRDRLFCRRYYEFFNTNPYLAGYVIGGLLRLEQDRDGQGGLPRGRAQTFRDSLGRALASLGDQLFWLGLRPAAALLACLVALGTAGAAPVVLGMLAVLLIAGQFAWRWRAIGRGYAEGYDLVVLLGDRRWHRAIKAAKRATLLLGGVLGGRILHGGWEQIARPTTGAWSVVGIMIVALALPVLTKRRWSGEFLILAAGCLGAVVAFALGAQGS